MKAMIDLVAKYRSECAELLFWFNSFGFISNRHSRRSCHRHRHQEHRKKRSPVVGRAVDGRVRSAWRSHSGPSTGVGRLVPRLGWRSLGSRVELDSTPPWVHPALGPEVDLHSENKVGREHVNFHILIISRSSSVPFTLLF